MDFPLDVSFLNYVDFDSAINSVYLVELPEELEVLTILVLANCNILDSTLRIGNDPSYANNDLCIDDVTECGFYECTSPLSG